MCVDKFNHMHPNQTEPVHKYVMHWNTCLKETGTDLRQTGSPRGKHFEIEMRDRIVRAAEHVTNETTTSTCHLAGCRSTNGARIEI
jgi:hypothetical protein